MEVADVFGLRKIEELLPSLRRLHEEIRAAVVAADVGDPAPARDAAAAAATIALTRWLM